METVRVSTVYLLGIAAEGGARGAVHPLSIHPVQASAKNAGTLAAKERDPSLILPEGGCEWAPPPWNASNLGWLTLHGVQDGVVREVRPSFVIVPVALEVCADDVESDPQPRARAGDLAAFTVLLGAWGAAAGYGIGSRHHWPAPVCVAAAIGLAASVGLLAVSALKIEGKFDMRRMRRLKGTAQQQATEPDKTEEN